MPYLEKAVAAHCGGWDKINGGQCTHAWRLLLGCKEQYTIRLGSNGMWSCLGSFNPKTKEWDPLRNSPHDNSLWPMAWPEVGGGGGLHKKVDCEDLFERMCEWDDTSYIMAAGTTAGSDTEDHDGIVDGHAYTILDCVNDVAGTDFDLIKVSPPNPNQCSSDQGEPSLDNTTLWLSSPGHI